MRKTYEKPFAEIAPLASQLMQEVNEPENSGTADNPWAKQNDEDYLKKVWD